MKPTAAQPYEPGDICAIQFDSPDAEAQYIVKTAQALHGVAFKDPTEDDPKHQRGLAWSDMAILLRSVSRNATPITAALDAANIRYVIVGMNNLFDTHEAHAARELFYYMAGRTTIVDLKSNDRAQPEQVTEAQLHIYALGYQELTGKNADLVEIYELDERKRNARAVDEDFIKDVKAKIATAAKALRAGTLNADPHPKKCAACDYLGMCTAGRQASATKP